MADLKLGSQIGGNLIWHQGILELNPLDDSLFYKEFDMITSKGGQTINGGISLKGDINSTGKFIGVGNDVGWGQAPQAAFNMDKDNTAGAHWLIASRKSDGSPRAGIQVLTSDIGETRIYTNKNANYVGFRDGQVYITATTPSAASQATRKDYVDKEVERAMQFAETTTDKLTADLATTNTRINTLDAQNVKITGNQNIAGTKTFTDLPVIQDQPTADTHATNKKYVDTKVGTAVQGIVVTAPLTTTGGVNPTLAINSATRTAAGSMSAQDKVKLDDLPADALSRSGGNMKNGGYINIEGVGGIQSLYNSKTYSILRDHNNGNVTLSAASGDLYLGYQTTADVYTTKNVVLHQAMKWNTGSGRVLVDTDGFIPWASIKDKIGLEGKSKQIIGATNFDEYESSGFYNLYNVTATGSINNPPFAYGTMLVIGSDKDTRTFVTQIATDKSTGAVYVRVRNDSNFAWNSAGWVKQIDERGGTLKDLTVTERVQMKNGYDADLKGIIHKTFESLGNIADNKPILILLAKRGSTTAIERNGFMGRIHFNRGATTSNLQGDYIDLVAYSGYTEQFYRINYISGPKMAGTKLVYHTHTDGIEYIALSRPANSMAAVVLDGLYWNITPVLIADATGKTMTDLVTRQSFYTDYNKPTNEDLDLVSRNGDTMTGTLRAATIKNSIMVNDKGSISFQDGASTRFHLASEGNSLTLKHGNDGQNALVTYLGDGSITSVGPVTASAFRSSGDYGFVRSTNNNQGMFVGADGRTIIGAGTGALILRPQGISTATGETTFNNDGTVTLGKQGTAAGHLVNKDYVDAVDAKNVAKTGDTMTGALTMPKIKSALVLPDKASIKFVDGANTHFHLFSEGNLLKINHGTTGQTNLMSIGSDGDVTMVGNLINAKSVSAPTVLSSVGDRKLAMEISSGADNLPYISVDFAYRALEFNDNKRVTATQGFEINSRNSNGDYYVNYTGFGGGWARGLRAVNSTGVIGAGIGFVGSGDTLTDIYLGVGATPWGDNSTSGIKLNATKLYLNKDTWATSGKFQIMSAANNILEFHTPGKHARMIWMDGNTGQLNIGTSNGSFNEATRIATIGNSTIELNGATWASSYRHDYAGQHTTVAPFQVNYGAVAGASDYYPLVRSRGYATGTGYTTDVELGVLRSGGTWGSGVIRVASAEAGSSGVGAAFYFDISGNFKAPAGVYDSGNRCYSASNPVPAGAHNHLNIRARGQTTLWAGDISNGNFVLNQPWTNFDMILFVGAWDNNECFTSKTFTRYDLEYMQGIVVNYDISGGAGGVEWYGRFAADNQTFVTYKENSRMRMVIGYNMQTVN